MVQSAIALGSNLGDSLSILNESLNLISQSPEIDLKACSSWYRTVPIGPPQPNYLNGCAILETNLSPEKLLQILLKIEQHFGRIRREKWGPRTLDLDLLLYNDLILETDHLQIPHPRMLDRAFVLVPLVQIAPTWVHPVTQKTIIELLDGVDCSGVSLDLTP